LTIEPAVEDYLPDIVDLLELSVPVNVKVCEPATAVRVTLWPLSVPVIGEDPPLHNVGFPPPSAGGNEME
jgi:hypothetical protein